jgi:hypothetical protein
MLRDDQTALLEGLPPHWRYALTGGNDDSKVCFEEGWNHKGSGRTLEDVLRVNKSPTPYERWKSSKLIGVGAITGPESGGLLVVDFDGTGSQALRAFHDHFHRSPKTLPATLCNESGKKGRGKVFLRVPPHWWPQLENRSASWKVDDKVVLEAIWMNGTGTGRHAVICGDHPQSSHQHPLYYRWMKAHSPAEVQWADAPEWLLLGIIAKFDEQIPDSPEERRRSGEDDPTPWERLKTHEKLQLAKEALEFCPNRDGRGSGTYEKVRRIICGLIDEFGGDIATAIVEDSEWNTRNDWGQNNNAEKTIASLTRSSVAEDQRARIGSLFHFARNNGFQWPTWSLPPIEQAQLHVDGLKKMLHKMNEVSHDHAALAAWEGRARREFGVDPSDLYRLRLEQYLGVVSSGGPRTMEEIINARRTDNVASDVLDGLLPRRVHVLAGGSHSGKTTLACFLAGRILNGQPVDVGNTRHGINAPGRVLILTSDCSDEDMVRDLVLEGIKPQECADRLRISSGSTFEDMIPIVQTLSEFTPDLVICDCLASMAVHGVKIGDPAYADPIRLLVRHNGISWPKAAFMVLHHTSRDEPLRFSGTEQIKASCEEMWVYYDPELIKQKKTSPSFNKTRHLLVEKSRGGYAGRKLHVTRDGYSGIWQWMNPNEGDSSPLETLGAAFRRVTDDEWRIPSEWMSLLDLQFNERTLRRYMDRLVGTVLESEALPNARVKNKTVLHYRPRLQVRTSARQMLTSKGDGINVV